ncbi:MAG: hypothetical protein ACR2LI_00995 [Propionibacteriaceae bacterium]
MSDRHTFIRSLHDLGMAAWFGGSLMGAVGLNGAAAEAKDPSERLRLSSLGWAKWTPVQLAAVAAHTVGGLGLMITARKRVANQPGAGSVTVVKLILTVAAAGTTAYSGVLGAKIKKHDQEGASGTTEPSATASPELEAAQKQLKALQWATPLLMGSAVVLGAVEGEQQRSGGGLIELGVGGLARELVGAVGAKGARAVKSV